MKPELRHLPISLRASTTDAEGVLEGYASVYDVEYRIGHALNEAIAPGAFDRSIADQSGVIPIFYMHDWDNPIGHAAVTSDSKGVKVVATLYVAENERARSVWMAAKAKALREWSIGFYPTAIEVRMNDDGTELETVTEGDLAEASVVVRGANPSTEMLNVREQKDAKVTTKPTDEKPKPKSRSYTDAERLARMIELGFIEGATIEERVRGLKFGDDPRPIMTPRAFADHLRALEAPRVRTNITNATGAPNPQWFEDHVTQPARGGRIFPLFRVVEQTEAQVAIGEEGSVTEVAAPADYGSSLAQSNVSFTKQEVNGSRFGAFIEATVGAMEDSKTLADAVRMILKRDVERQIDSEVTTGDGSGTAFGKHFTGLANASLPTLDATSLGPWAALVQAAATVRASDWLGSITCVLSVTDTESLASETDSNGQATFANALASLRLLDADHFVFSTLPPAGTGYVASFKELGELYVREAPTVELTREHANDFVSGLVCVKVEGRLGFRVSYPSAGVQVTGL